MEIKDLKAGDEVYFEYWGGWRDYWSKSIVKRITPTGLIRVNGTYFRQEGYSRGGSARNYPLDDETARGAYEAQQKEKFVRSMVARINSDGMTYEQAVKIKEILEDNEDDKCF